MFRLRKVFLPLILIFSLTLSRAFSQEIPDDDKKTLYSIREFFFEITRYKTTGLLLYPECQALASISEIPARLMTQRKCISSPLDSVYLCEYYNLQKRGIIDSSFCPEDLFSVAESYEVVSEGSEDEAGKPESEAESSESEAENLEGEAESAENVPETESESAEDKTEETETKPEIAENAGPAPDWIDYILQSFESYSPSKSGTFDVTDGSRILEMLEGGDDRGIDGLEESKIESALPQEFTYTKRNGNLRRFSYDGEQFTAWKEGENTVLVNFYGEKLIRKKFDPLYRLVKSERFKITTAAKNISLESSLDYTYLGENTLPSQSVEEQFDSKKRLVNKFDESGRSISLLESHYEEREVKSKGKKKSEKAETETVLLDDKKTTNSYDEKGRTLLQEVVTWTYKKTFSGKFNRNERSVKSEFDYSSVTDENNLPPNLKFYENGELHLERNYKNQNSYSEKLYFEDGFSVEVVYEGGVKKTEIIYINGKEQRRREFEH